MNIYLGLGFDSFVPVRIRPSLQCQMLPLFAREPSRTPPSCFQGSWMWHNSLPSCRLLTKRPEQVEDGGWCSVAEYIMHIGAGRVFGDLRDCCCRFTWGQWEEFTEFRWSEHFARFCLIWLHGSNAHTTPHILSAGRFRKSSLPILNCWWFGTW